MKSKWLSRGLLCLSLVFAAGIAAHADTVSLWGSVWKVPFYGPAPSAGDAELPTPTTPPDVTFSLDTSTSIDLSTSNGLGPDFYVVGNFITYEGGGVLAGDDGFGSQFLSDWDYTYGSYFSLTGTINVRHGELFTFGHSSGASIYIDGSPIMVSPGRVDEALYNFGTFTYNGPTIDGANLQIVFAVCCRDPAYLITNLPIGGSTTPEPSTTLLMAGGLAAIGLARRYRSIQLRRRHCEK